MVTIDDIVTRLGGVEEAARLTGVSPDAIRKWRQAGTIPPRHWPAIMAATGLTMADLQADPPSPVPPGADAALVLADGTIFWGRGFGHHTPPSPSGTPASAIGEICFNTGMTGYQETLSDPSYAGQLICFTFPHIGNTGTNPEDMEATNVAARGLITKQDITAPSNWRSAKGAEGSLDGWLKARRIPGLSGVDTRALTMRIRDGGPPSGILAYPADGKFDLPALQAAAASWPGLDGMDLARDVTCAQTYTWNQTEYAWPTGYGTQSAPRFHVVAVDYGAKRNILRCLASAGCRVTVVPATATAQDILRHNPDGVFLSNGPGDPAATGAYAVPAIQGVMAAGTPIFGICLGHQLLALALGGRTYKLDRGHRGANQPVKDLTTGRVEITAQNHGFAVDDSSLPDGVTITHRSLFDGSNEGIACTAKRAFSVQYHPEASPGPSDSHYLFHRFVETMESKHTKVGGDVPSPPDPPSLI